MLKGEKMMQLSLAPEERDILREALQSYLSDLRMEIADTERKEMRENLKNEEKVLKKIIEALKPS
jgi:hypothetical protein